MPRFDDPRYDDDFRHDERRFPDAMPNSGPGVVSFVLSIAALFLAFGFIAFAAIHADDDPAFEIENFTGKGAFMLATLLGSVGLALIGIILGIVGCSQSDRRKLFAVLGLSFNLLMLFGWCGLMAIGFAMQGAF